LMPYWLSRRKRATNESANIAATAPSTITTTLLLLFIARFLQVSSLQVAARVRQVDISRRATDPKSGHLRGTVCGRRESHPPLQALQQAAVSLPASPRL